MNETYHAISASLLSELRKLSASVQKVSFLGDFVVIFLKNQPQQDSGAMKTAFMEILSDQLKSDYELSIEHEDRWTYRRV
jgi:uncharacterized protein YtpQ (UPF0354 family)